MKQNCNHDTTFWLGKPPGCVPSMWECSDCGVVMTAGEFILYKELLAIKAALIKKPATI